MIASVSLAARESFFGSTDSRASSQARSFAVRKVHLPAMRTRLTPRGAYSACRRRIAAAMSTPSGRRERKVLSSSGSPAANKQRLDQPQLLRPLLRRRLLVGSHLLDQLVADDMRLRHDPFPLLSPSLNRCRAAAVPYRPLRLRRKIGANAVS